jgi:hypothetical protein
MILPINAEYTQDRKVVQSTRFRVNSQLASQDRVGVGDVVFVRDPPKCPQGSVGFIRELGADAWGNLIVRIDLIKADPNSWPVKALWVYPDHLWKGFTERWWEQPPAGEAAGCRS